MRRRQHKRTARIWIGYRRYDVRRRQLRLRGAYRRQKSDCREGVTAHHVYDVLCYTANLGFGLRGYNVKRSRQASFWQMSRRGFQADWEINWFHEMNL